MLPGLVLAAVVVLAAVSHRTGAWGALGLGFASVLWLRLNGHAEGTVLWELNPWHGLTETDLAGLAGLGIAGIRAVQWLRRAGWARGTGRSAAAARRDAEDHEVVRHPSALSTRRRGGQATARSATVRWPRGAPR